MKHLLEKSIKIRQYAQYTTLILTIILKYLLLLLNDQVRSSIYAGRIKTSCLLRKLLKNHPHMAQKILKFITFRHQQNAFSRLKICVKLLFTKTAFPKGVFLTCYKQKQYELGEQVLPGTPSLLPLAPTEMFYATDISKYSK